MTLIDGNKWMDQSSKRLQRCFLTIQISERLRQHGLVDRVLRRAGFAPNEESLRHCSRPRTLGLASDPSHPPQYTSFKTLTRARSGARCHSAMRLRETAVPYDPARPPQTVAAGISTTLDQYWSATLGSAARSSVATSRINANAGHTSHIDSGRAARVREVGWRCGG